MRTRFGSFRQRPLGLSVHSIELASRPALPARSPDLQGPPGFFFCSPTPTCAANLARLPLVHHRLASQAETTKRPARLVSASKAFLPGFFSLAHFASQPPPFFLDSLPPGRILASRLRHLPFFSARPQLPHFNIIGLSFTSFLRSTTPPDRLPKEKQQRTAFNTHNIAPRKQPIGDRRLSISSLLNISSPSWIWSFWVRQLRQLASFRDSQQPIDRVSKRVRCFLSPQHRSD